MGSTSEKTHRELESRALKAEQALEAANMESAKLRSETDSSKTEIAALRSSVMEHKNALATLEKRTMEEKERITIDFQAAVTFRSGDTKPIPNTEFIILRKSLAEIMVETGSQGIYGSHDKKYSGPSYQTIAYLFTGSGEGPENAAEINKLLGGFRKYGVATFRTNMTGVASPEGISQGKYWIVGFTKIGDGRIIWDHEATISSGKNQIYLDVKNAAFAQ